jgi:hypothetical protein
MLRSYIVATGMDKYWVLYSVTEVEGSEHNADVIVAVAKDGKPLTEDGQLSSSRAEINARSAGSGTSQPSL